MSILERPIAPVVPDELELIPTLPAEPVTRRDVLLRAAELCGAGTSNPHCVLSGIFTAHDDLHGHDGRFACPQAAELIGYPGHWHDIAEWSDAHTASRRMAALRRLADGKSWQEATQ